MSNCRSQSGVCLLACTLFLSSGVLIAGELKDDAPEAADAMKAWYAFYQHEATNVYRFRLEPDNVDLELDPKPILRWTNPLEEGSIHGVVYVWRHNGKPVVVGQLFSYLNGKGGWVY